MQQPAPDELDRRQAQDLLLALLLLIQVAVIKLLELHVPPL